MYVAENGSWKHLGYTTNLYGTITKLNAGEKYTFAVRSYIKLENTVIAGNYKAIETATKPLAPTNLRTSSTKSAITLTWNKVNGADGYRVYYKNTENESWKIAVNATANTAKTWNNLPGNTTYIFAVKPYIKTASGVVWGSYTTVTDKTLNASDNCIAVTDGGVKLYKVTSSEAIAICNKWSFSVNDVYEGKNKDGKTLMFAPDRSGWFGVDIDGAFYDGYGNIEYCPYCGKISGMGNNMCYGCKNSLEYN